LTREPSNFLQQFVQSVMSQESPCQARGTFFVACQKHLCRFFGSRPPSDHENRFSANVPLVRQAFLDKGA
jgi:hypothetical protein